MTNGEQQKQRTVEVLFSLLTRHFGIIPRLFRQSFGFHDTIKSCFLKKDGTDSRKIFFLFGWFWFWLVGWVGAIAEEKRDGHLLQQIKTRVFDRFAFHIFFIFILRHHAFELSKNYCIKQINIYVCTFHVATLFCTYRICRTCLPISVSKASN